MRGRDHVPPPCSFRMTDQACLLERPLCFMPCISRCSNQFHFHFAKSPVSDKAEVS
jgi:hypothetical protein